MSDPVVGVSPVAGAPSPVPPETPFDAPDDTLGSQIARTDAALVAWRDESVRRRAEFEARLAREREEALRQRKRLLRTAFAGAATVAVIAAVVGAGALTSRALPEPARLPAPVEVAPAVARPVVAPPVAAPPVEVAPPIEVAPPPVAPVEVAPAPAVVAPPTEALVVRDAKLWSDRTHAWVAFATPDRSALRLHWKDAAGAEVLEPMGCGAAAPDGLRRCRAGRSHGRIARALAEGARPGTWTVEACGEAGCAVVGTFAVGG